MTLQAKIMTLSLARSSSLIGALLVVWVNRVAECIRVESWVAEALHVLAAAIAVARILPVVLVVHWDSDNVEVGVGCVANACRVGCARAGVHEAARLASIGLGSEGTILLLEWELTHRVWWWARLSCLVVDSVSSRWCKEHSHDREDAHLEAEASSYVLRSGKSPLLF